MQVGSLYTSMFLGIVAGIGTSVINTRVLGPQQYGDLKFLQTLFTFVPSFLTLGVFISGSRLLAQRKNETIKNALTGSLLILAGILSLVLALGFFVFSFFEESIFENHLGQVIRIFSPFLFVYPFQLCLENIMQGDNKIYELSAFKLSPQIFYVVGAILLNNFVPLKLVYALAIQFLALAISIFVLTILSKPKFEKVKENFLIIWEENKKYGFQVYIGILTGVATAHLGPLSIAYFIDNTNVGFFSLALGVTMPLTMIPSSVGTTFFRDFANSISIPKRTTVVTICLSVCSLFLFFLVIEKIILFLYSEEYGAVVTIAYLVSIGSLFHGFGDYINRFLGAHGKGKQLRDAAIAVGVSNVLGYTLLVHAFGLKGAAITRSISGIIYFGMMFLFYTKANNEWKGENLKNQQSFFCSRAGALLSRTPKSY